MRNEELRHYLKSKRACKSAIDWIADRDLQSAWSECARGDWMLWFAQRAGVDIRMLTAAKAECAALAWQWMPEEARAAVTVARAFARGEATQKEMQKAADAAYAAACTAYAAVAARKFWIADAADAADAAAYAAAVAAAYTAYDAAYAAVAAAYTAYADAAAAAAAQSFYAGGNTGDANHAETLYRCADIVREIIPFTEIQKLMK